MNRWMEIGAFVSMLFIVGGLAIAFLIDGKEWASIAGTIPGIVYVIACHFRDWSREP